MAPITDAEAQRLAADERRETNWKRWGPYLSERQWGTVREDYSADGTCWEYLSHDQARSRAYRWGEDGLLGITDRQCRLCFALALWNERDPILKERLFGLTSNEGNHGEDVKESYFYLDSTPTHSYMKALYKYPQVEFPYARLVAENRRRGRKEREFELEDAGVFDEGRYFDVAIEYAKAAPEDILVRIVVANRGDRAAPLHLLPTVWQRNTWSWGRTGEGYFPRGRIARLDARCLQIDVPTLDRLYLSCEAAPGCGPDLIFTDNETNFARLFGSKNESLYVKDGFHRRVVEGAMSAVRPEGFGTKAAAWYRLSLPPRSEMVVRLRLSRDASDPAATFGADFDRVFEVRRAEADAFYAARRNSGLEGEALRVTRQADAGLMWSKQFYSYVVDQWLEGDPGQPPPPAARMTGRNADWSHVYARDVISMPDKWEYPWFAAWDLAFHCVALARVDPDFAKSQLLLLTRDWYMHPNGQFPAYEFALGDVNPPVFAWAARRVYQLSAAGGARDRKFLARAFQKCLVNFTWWVNRKDADGNHLFSGGFLGLDNIGIFDRSKPLPEGGQLEQADGTAWMAFYCTTMLAIALELAKDDPSYADVASKFFEHFVSISEAMNAMGGIGLWDEQDGFYYDQAHLRGAVVPLRIRSMVGLIPLFAAEVLEDERLSCMPDFKRRLDWFVENKPHLAKHIATTDGAGGHRLLAIPTRERLIRLLGYVLDEREFLSPYGVRSLSKVHAEKPYAVELDGVRYEVRYEPGESETGLFGGNSNWRGPVWLPVNYLLIEALKRHHHFYGDELQVECPTGSGRRMNLLGVACELELRLAKLFLPDAGGRRPCHGGDRRYAEDPHFRDLVLFYEHFDGEDGRGIGANHQTGWTALIGNVLERVAAMHLRRTREGG
jgi:Glycosyl hydrolase family 63 C-terminal domain